MTRFAEDYVDVATRIQEFYGRYPDGRLCYGSPPRVVEIDGQHYVWYHARAYRTPDDPHPGDGWAAEPVPGRTPYTKDSELQNAETSAWGRAIVALGFETKHLASAQEVAAREADSVPFPDAVPAAELDELEAEAAAISDEMKDKIVTWRAEQVKKYGGVHRQTFDAVRAHLLTERAAVKSPFAMPEKAAGGESTVSPTDVEDAFAA
jgi:hypothetical protein